LDTYWSRQSLAIAKIAGSFGYENFDENIFVEIIGQKVY
jgi:hypothetical protein